MHAFRKLVTMMMMMMMMMIRCCFQTAVFSKRVQLLNWDEGESSVVDKGTEGEDEVEDVCGDNGVEGTPRTSSTDLKRS